MKTQKRFLILFLLGIFLFYSVSACTDADGDGYNVSEGGCGVADCDDNNEFILPPTSSQSTTLSTDITFCPGTYYRNVTASGQLFYVGSNVNVVCNNTRFIGNGSNLGYLFHHAVSSGSTISGCYVENYGVATNVNGNNNDYVNLTFNNTQVYLSQENDSIINSTFINTHVVVFGFGELINNVFSLGGQGSTNYYVATTSNNGVFAALNVMGNVFGYDSTVAIPLVIYNSSRAGFSSHVENNIFSGAFSSADLEIRNAQNVVIKNNTFAYSPIGISIRETPSMAGPYTLNITIENNTFFHLTSNGVSVPSGNASGINISRNTFFNVSGHGVNFNGVWNSTIFGNNITSVGSSNTTSSYLASNSPLNVSGRVCDNGGGGVFYSYGEEGGTVASSDNTELVGLTPIANFDAICIDGTGIGLSDNLTMYVSADQGADSCDVVSGMGFTCYFATSDVLIFNGAGQDYTFNSSALNASTTILSGYSNPNINYSETTTASYGVNINNSSRNFIYNNYFNNTYNAYDDSANNYWNITKVLGTNILLGSYLGGNYFDDYSGTDVDQDGIGSSNYSILGSLAWDFLPLVKDVVAPTLSLSSSSTTTTSITVSSSCSDTNSGVSTCVLSSSAGSVSGSEITGLSCGTTATITLTSTDYLGNSATASLDASTSACTSSGGGSGGGGTTSTSTTSITEGQLNEGYSRALGVKGKVNFNFESETHSVGVLSLTSTTATIEVASTPQQVNLTVGEEKKFDLNSDGFYDLFVKLNSIENSKANIEIKKINEKIIQEVPEGVSEEKNAEEIKEFAEKVERNKNIFWIALLILIVILFVYIAIHRHRKKRRHKKFGY